MGRLTIAALSLNLARLMLMVKNHYVVMQLSTLPSVVWMAALSFQSRVPDTDIVFLQIRGECAGRRRRGGDASLAGKENHKGELIVTDNIDAVCDGPHTGRVNGICMYCLRHSSIGCTAINYLIDR